MLCRCGRRLTRNNNGTEEVFLGRLIAEQERNVPDNMSRGLFVSQALQTRLLPLKAAGTGTPTSPVRRPPAYPGPLDSHPRAL